MKSPLTIVIPVYNRARTLPRLLRSIDAQTLAPAAVVLVDNASTDDSMRVMTEWAGRRCDTKVVSQPRRGASAARNRGLQEVATEWTMFFDSDDEMLPRHVEEFSRAIADNPLAGIIGRNVIYRRNGTERVTYYSESSPLFNHLFRSTLSTLRYVARTSLFRTVGGWDESLSGWDDYELGVRLLLQKPVMATVPGPPSVRVYFESESISGETFGAHPERWERSLDLIRKHLEGRKADNVWLDARTVILAAEYAREGFGGLSARLRDKVLSRTASPWRMRLVYAYMMHFGRFAWVFARMLFPFTNKS